MKRLIIILSLGLASLIGFAQSNVADFRYPNAVTAFGKNIPVGTSIWDIANKNEYRVDSAIVSTYTITTAIAANYLTLINSDDQTASEVNITDAGNHWAGTNVEAALQEAGVSIGNLEDYLHPAVTVTDGATIDFTLTGQNITAATIDGAINHDALLNFTATEHFTQAAISIPSTQISDFSTAVAATAAVTANTAKVTNATHTGDVTGTTALTIANDAVTYAKMQNVVGNNVLLGNNSGAGGVVDELTATEARTILNIADGAQVNYNPRSQTFSEDDGTPTAHALTYTAVTSGVTVTQNGAVLPPASYSLTTTSLTLLTIVYQYDEVIIYYNSTN